MPTPIAIDIGSKHCAVASLNAEGIPTLVQDRRDRHSFLTPIKIAVTPDQVVVGHEAQQLWNDDPGIELLSGLVDHLGTGKSIVTKAHPFSPESLCALIIKKLKSDSESSWAGPIENVVLSVSSILNSRQRQGLVRATRLAGIEQCELVDSTLAASFFLQPEASEKPILICDICDSHIQASIVRSTPNERTMVSNCIDRSIGGCVISDAITAQLLKPIDVSTIVASKRECLTRSLAHIAQSIKAAFLISDVNHVSDKQFVVGIPIEIDFQRSQFLTLCTRLSQAIAQCIKTCMQKANVAWNDIHAVHLLGEMAMARSIHNFLIEQTACPEKLLHVQQPIFGRAYGASIYAWQGLKIGSPLVLRPLADHGIGIRTRDRQTNQLVVNPIVPNDALLPFEWSFILKTSRIDQERLVVDLVQTHKDDSQSISLGAFEFGPLKPQSVRHPINVSIHQDGQGIVKVSAHDGVTGHAIRQLPFASPSERTRQQIGTDIEGYNWGIERLRS